MLVPLVEQKMTGRARITQSILIAKTNGAVDATNMTQTSIHGRLDSISPNLQSAITIVAGTEVEMVVRFPALLTLWLQENSVVLKR